MMTTMDNWSSSSAWPVSPQQGANATATASPPVPPPTTGKRARDTNDDQLAREQRLAKRFGLLHLGMIHSSLHSRPNAAQQSKTNHQPDPAIASSSPIKQPIASPPSASPLPTSTIPPSYNPTEETIEIDETPTRIHISSLNNELASIAASEAAAEAQRLYFHPDIDKHLAALQKKILRSEGEEEEWERVRSGKADLDGKVPGAKLRATKDNSIVLYAPEKSSVTAAAGSAKEEPAATSTSMLDAADANGLGRPSRARSEPAQLRRERAGLAESILTLAGYGHGDQGEDDVDVDVGLSDEELADDDDDEAMDID